MVLGSNNIANIANQINSHLGCCILSIENTRSNSSALSNISMLGIIVQAGQVVEHRDSPVLFGECGYKVDGYGGCIVIRLYDAECDEYDFEVIRIGDKVEFNRDGIDVHRKDGKYTCMRVVGKYRKLSNV